MKTSQLQLVTSPVSKKLILKKNHKHQNSNDNLVSIRIYILPSICMQNISYLFLSVRMTEKARDILKILTNLEIYNRNQFVKNFINFVDVLSCLIMFFKVWFIRFFPFFIKNATMNNTLKSLTLVTLLQTQLVKLKLIGWKKSLKENCENSFASGKFFFKWLQKLYF